MTADGRPPYVSLDAHLAPADALGLAAAVAVILAGTEWTAVAEAGNAEVWISADPSPFNQWRTAGLASRKSL